MQVRQKAKIFMMQAIELAKQALLAGEVPVGAVVVDENGKVISAAYNQVEERNSQACHAEILAIDSAAKLRKNWRLSKCWIYVTLEPCSMCMGLIRLSRFEGVVYGAPSPLYGYHLDATHSSKLYKKKDVIVIEGVLESESKELLQTFFKKERGSSEA
ncbi:nucleoside deaminase [bacterium]|nr:nucleoside deaminase [bacterium]MBT4577531.1 nucleoside deaminase [bacterium]MBT6528638.1 nucleoside deaminase [bacterium]